MSGIAGMQRAAPPPPTAAAVNGVTTMSAAQRASSSYVTTTTTTPPLPAAGPAARSAPTPFSSLVIGASIQLFEVSTVGQPLEVIKTHLAAYRSHTFLDAVRHTYQRGGVLGFYQGLIPWAIIEASTKGSILFFSQSLVSSFCVDKLGLGIASAGLVGGACGGVAQAYTTMGFCTLMKTVEVTRQKSLISHSLHANAINSSSGSSVSQQGSRGSLSTLSVARDILRREGVMGMYRGVGALAARQFTNWGSRFGISRGAEQLMQEWNSNNSSSSSRTESHINVHDGVTKKSKKHRELAAHEKIIASAIGGMLACWNHPIEVIRIELQRFDVQSQQQERSMLAAARRIYTSGGLAAFFRGMTPRVMHSVALTVLMVYGGDEMKKKMAK